MSHVLVRDVDKSYQVGENTVRALRGLSLEIAKSEIAVVLGPSGSGKTTLLNILGGLEPPDRGDVSIEGESVNGMSEAELSVFRRRRIGFVFQFFNLVPTLTALENVTLAGELVGAPDADARALLEDVGLAQRADHYPGNLSGGEQQRVAIARALVKKPSLVLADEPTGSLDAATGVEVLRLLRRLNQEHGHTFVIVTHNAAFAQMADRVIRLADGRVEELTTNAQPRDPAELSW